jgi:hypothetical protein
LAESLQEQAAQLHSQKNSLERGKTDEIDQVRRQLAAEVAKVGQLDLELTRQREALEESERHSEELEAARARLEEQLSEYEKGAAQQKHRTVEVQRATGQIGDPGQYIQDGVIHRGGIGELLAWRDSGSGKSGFQPDGSMSTAQRTPDQAVRDAALYDHLGIASRGRRQCSRGKIGRMVFAAAGIFILVVPLGFLAVVSFCGPEVRARCGRLLQFSWSDAVASHDGEVTAIMYSDDKPTAIVGDQLVHDGDIVCGVRVVRIHKDMVEFEKNGKAWSQLLYEMASAHWRIQDGLTTGSNRSAQQ